jgi:hypothetical protein
MDIVTRILRYLKGCPKKGLLYTRKEAFKVSATLMLIGVDHKMTETSISGYCTFIGETLVLWRSKKQSIVARSTAEDGFQSMAHGVCKVLWLRILLADLGFF